MRAKLLTHSHAEDEMLYRRLKASQHETSRKFAEEGEREHQLAEQQLQRMLAGDDKLDAWMTQLSESAARATSSTRTSWRLWEQSKDELMVNAV